MTVVIPLIALFLMGFADDHSIGKAFCPDTNEAEENTIKILEHDLSHIKSLDDYEFFKNESYQN